MNCLRKQSTGDVSVEVNACPGPDLRQILEDLRCQYETLIARNRKEVEDWYECKVSDMCLLPTDTHTSGHRRASGNTLGDNKQFFPYSEAQHQHLLSTVLHRRHRPV